MKIGVSNIAWGQEDEPAILEHLSHYGARGVEVAPSRLAPWSELSPRRLENFRTLCARYELVIPSLQALFFGLAGPQLLGDEESFDLMTAHMHALARHAHILGAEVAVFGAPKNRQRHALSPSKAMELGTQRLQRIGDIIAPYGLTVGIEPIPPCYGGDFLTNTRETVEMVQRCNHPHIRVHLDTACLCLAGDDLANAISLARPVLVHYHVSEEHLGGFSAPRLPHDQAGQALRNIHYDRWAIIEMKAPASDPFGAIATACQHARTHYQHQAGGHDVRT